MIDLGEDFTANGIFFVFLGTNKANRKWKDQKLMSVLTANTSGGKNLF